MSHEFHISTNYGHPWTGQVGWDLLEAKADTEQELDKFIEAAERKFWNTWIRDNTGQVAVVMYKPTGALRKWKCKAVDNGRATEIVWL
jgi:hypothetical protein